MVRLVRMMWAAFVVVAVSTLSLPAFAQGVAKKGLEIYDDLYTEVRSVDWYDITKHRNLSAMYALYSKLLILYDIRYHEKDSALQAFRKEVALTLYKELERRLAVQDFSQGYMLEVSNIPHGPSYGFEGDASSPQAIIDMMKLMEYEMKDVFPGMYQEDDEYNPINQEPNPA